MSQIRILVVDDSPLDRRLAGHLLERAGWLTAEAVDGAEALEQVAMLPPDVVVTDMMMPRVDGLRLVETLHNQFPTLPVMLMTAHGSEEIAVAALRAGAVGYVPKRHLALELVPTIYGLLELTRPLREQQQVLEAIRSCHVEFSLGNETNEGAVVGRQVELWMNGLGLFSQCVRLQVSISLRELLSNAVLHGNLELESSLREIPGAWEEQLATRMVTEPYRTRRVSLSVHLDRSGACFGVTDDGPGFDVRAVEQIGREAALDQLHGRGLFLIRTFMDEVSYSPRGNEVTIRKRAP